MNVELTTMGRVVVARAVGDIDMGNAAGLLAAITAGCSNDAIGVVLDLSDTTYLDSAGIQMVFDLARSLDRTRRGFGVVVPEESPLRRVVKIAHVDEAALLCSALDECVSGLEEDRGGRL